MDYRATHQDQYKGRSYDESFTRLPYRRIVWEWEKDVLNEILQDINKSKTSKKYLDFACGTGRILGLLERYMEESYGIDVSESMLKVAKENVQHANLLLSDLTKEEVFPDSYFDLITAFRFFLNAQQDLRESTLCVFKKILKKDGYFILNIHMSRGCLLEKELRVYQRLNGIENPNFHSMSVQETKNLLSKHHFDVIQTFHYGVLPISREEHRLLIDRINSFERYCSNFPFFLNISRYVIYVCRFISNST